MEELSKPGSKGEGDGVGSEIESDAEQVQGPKCPVCAAISPRGSKYCPMCGTWTDRSPEGVAAFSLGPQHAMMKEQTAALRDIRAELSTVKRHLHVAFFLKALAYLVLLYMLFWIAKGL